MGSTLDAKNLRNGNEPVWYMYQYGPWSNSFMIGQLVSQVFFFLHFFKGIGQQVKKITIQARSMFCENYGLIFVAFLLLAYLFV